MDTLIETRRPIAGPTRPPVGAPVRTGAPRRPWAMIVVLLAWPVVVPVRAQQPDASYEGRTVRSIRVIGNVRVSTAFIQEHVQDTVVGRPYTRKAVQADYERLMATRRFSSVKPSIEPVDDQVEVIFVVEELPTIAEIQIIGNKRFKTVELRKLLGFSEGDFRLDYQINAGREAILRKYRQKGYHDVSVEIDREALADNRVVYTITEGPRVRVRKIRFEGNDSISARTLRGQIKTSTYIWIFRTGELNDEQLEEDRVSLRDYYRGQGFLDANVAQRVEWSPDKKDVTVVFGIQEGVRYSIASIDLQGNTVFTDDELRDVMGLAEGDWLIREQVAQDIKAIETKYGSVGYIPAALTTNGTKIRSNIVYDPQAPGKVHLGIEIVEGQRFKNGRIVVRGNELTQDRVVRRVLNFYPDEYYDVSAARLAEQRLRETRLFSEARITPEGTEPGVRDVLVQVKEAQTTNLIAGVGVTSNSGLLGNLQIRNSNFDITDWPKSATELFKGRAFKGAGQILNLQFEPGTELTRARIDFREPWLFDRPISLGFSGYVFERGRGAYDERRIGTNVSLGKRFKKGFAAEIAPRFEAIKISGVDPLAARDIREDEGNSFLTSAKFTVLRDTRDSLFLTTRGYLVKVSWEQAGTFGGDYSFSKLIGGAKWFRRLYTDVMDRPHVIGLRGNIGYIFGDSPVFERFYGGGIGSVRGFEFRGISPRAGVSDDRIGGDFMVLTGAEYSFPLYGKQLRGVTFLDMGTVEEDFEVTSWRAAVGFGVRVTLNFFGPVPMAFDLAFPFAKDSDDDTQVFSFSLGTTF